VTNFLAYLAREDDGSDEFFNIYKCYIIVTMFPIHFRVFILSFLLGILCVYITSPAPTKITVYSTNDNKHLFQFSDKADNCFQLKQTVVKCSNDAEEIPLQI